MNEWNESKLNAKFRVCQLPLFKYIRLEYMKNGNLYIMEVEDIRTRFLVL